MAKQGFRSVLPFVASVGVFLPPLIGPGDPVVHQPLSGEGSSENAPLYRYSTRSELCEAEIGLTGVKPRGRTEVGPARFHPAWHDQVDPSSVLRPLRPHPQDWRGMEASSPPSWLGTQGWRGEWKEKAFTTLPRVNQSSGNVAPRLEFVSRPAYVTWRSTWRTVGTGLGSWLEAAQHERSAGGAPGSCSTAPRMEAGGALGPWQEAAQVRCSSATMDHSSLLQNAVALFLKIAHAEQSVEQEGVEAPLPADKLACHVGSRRSSQHPGLPLRSPGTPDCRGSPQYSGGPRPQAVLLLPGSFNPPTYMHLRILEVARDALVEQGWDVVGAYMSPVNDRYTKPGLVSSHHRLRMCQLATEDSQFIMVDSWEASQPEYQRTLAVLHRLHTALNPPSSPATQRSSLAVRERTELPTESVSPVSPNSALHAPDRKAGRSDQVAGNGDGMQADSSSTAAGPIQPCSSTTTTAGPIQPCSSSSTAAGPIQPCSSSTTAAGPMQPCSSSTTTAGAMQHDSRIQAVLVCGADLLESFTRAGVWIPSQVEDILANHGVVCVTRDGVDVRRLVFESDLLSKHKERILIADNSVDNNISSSRIRMLLRRGQSVSYLLPDKVLSYIHDHNMYNDP